MTRWTDTLPEADPQADPRGHGEMALQYLAWALQDERAGRREALLRDVRDAAAHVRAWRLSLPKDQQAKRVWIHSASDRRLIRSAMHEVLWADGSTTRTRDRALALRHAEAALRTLGKRLQAEVSAEPARTAPHPIAMWVSGARWAAGVAEKGELRDENPYCMRCGKHLGMPFHETNEHDDAAKSADA